MQGSFPKKELWERRAEGTEGVGVGGGVPSPLGEGSEEGPENFFDFGS